MDSRSLWYKELGHRLYQARKHHKMSSDQVGRRFGCTGTSILNIESGKYRAKILLALELAAFFGVAMPPVPVTVSKSASS